MVSFGFIFFQIIPFAEVVALHWASMVQMTTICEHFTFYKSFYSTYVPFQFGLCLLQDNITPNVDKSKRRLQNADKFKSHHQNTLECDLSCDLLDLLRQGLRRKIPEAKCVGLLFHYCIGSRRAWSACHHHLQKEQHHIDGMERYREPKHHQHEWNTSSRMWRRGKCYKMHWG